MWRSPGGSEKRLVSRLAQGLGPVGRKVTGDPDDKPSAPSCQRRHVPNRVSQEPLPNGERGRVRQGPLAGRSERGAVFWGGGASANLAGMGPFGRAICQFLARMAKICKLLKKIRYWSMMKKFHRRARVFLAVLRCSAVIGPRTLNKEV